MEPAADIFQQQAEYYLDPESLAMTSAALVRRLKAASSVRHRIYEQGHLGENQKPRRK